MASAESTYVDPSALRTLYVHEARSRAFCAWRARLGGSLPITFHGQAELVNSIQLAVFRGDLKVSIAAGAMSDLRDDLVAGRLHVADVPWRRVFERAMDLSKAHTATLGTRTLDVLHVATALALRSRSLVTYDARQAALARTTGMRVVQPGQS